MATHVWNLGVVQNQQFANRITLVRAMPGKTFFVLITNVAGAHVKILRGNEAVASLPANQSIAIASDDDVHLELEESPRRGATGNFSISA